MVSPRSMIVFAPTWMAIEPEAPVPKSVCPRTGQPDFGTLIVTYVPEKLCVELKSLKLYLQSFRNQGIFYEDVVNVILDELVRLLHPRRMAVVGRFSVRGGISSVVTATHEGRRRGAPRKR